MSELKEFYKRFWAEFEHSQNWNDSLIGKPSKLSHRNAGQPKPYNDFDAHFGLGFHPTATINAYRTTDRLQAQISTDSNQMEFIDYLEGKRSTIPIFSRLNICLHAKSDAKIEVTWENANLQCRQLWPVHHLWLRSSLLILAESFSPLINQFEREKP